MRSVLAKRPARSSLSASARLVRPAITPIEGSAGVDSVLARVARPFSSTATRSVKVPPTSMPMRYMAQIRDFVRNPPPLAGEGRVGDVSFGATLAGCGATAGFPLLDPPPRAGEEVEAAALRFALT